MISLCAAWQSQSQAHSTGALIHWARYCLQQALVQRGFRWLPLVSTCGWPRHRTFKACVLHESLGNSTENGATPVLLATRYTCSKITCCAAQPSHICYRVGRHVGLGTRYQLYYTVLNLLLPDPGPGHRPESQARRSVHIHRGRQQDRLGRGGHRRGVRQQVYPAHLLCRGSAGSCVPGLCSSVQPTEL